MAQSSVTAVAANSTIVQAILDKDEVLWDINQKVLSLPSDGVLG